MKGKLITFEGIEGCGKTTQLDLISREFTSRGTSFVRTREPGGTRIGEQIRQILLDPGNTDLANLAELYLYIADRAQHVVDRILPALERGAWVFCDRFTDATLAYQGYGRGLSRSHIVELNGTATAGRTPDLTFLIDLPVEAGLERANRRNRSRGIAQTEGRFEAEELAFHTRVRAGYLEMANQEPERFRIVDGTRTPEETHRQILSMMDPLI